MTVEHFDHERCKLHEANMLTMASQIADIHTTLGSAPNEATGVEGSGVARVLVERGEKIDRLYDLVVSQRVDADAYVRTAKIWAGTITGIATTVAGVVVAYFTAMNG
jgi:hypothetical protein